LNEANAALNNSGNFTQNGARFSLCYSMPIDWDDNRSAQEFRNFLFPSPTSMNSKVNSYRRLKRCDIVVGLTSTTASGDGWAYINPSCAGAGSVARIQVAGPPSYTATHEMFHTLGQGHLPGLGFGAYSYSHAWCNQYGPMDVMSTSSCKGGVRRLVMSGFHTYEGWGMGDADQNNTQSTANLWPKFSGCQ
jgi:hypothetical protein